VPSTSKISAAALRISSLAFAGAKASASACMIGASL
jgi:hypothetical protein